MLKKLGIIIVSLGAVLLIAALLLFLNNRNEDVQAGREAESLLTEVQSAISHRSETETEIIKDSSTEFIPDESESEMTIVDINGYGYIGYLSIPELQLNLPVMAEWDYNRLKIAPCRNFGSSKTDDLVIAAHNYNSHFGRLKDLSVGADVIFTDMDGIENQYKVEMIEILQPDEVERVQNSGYGLVLYTCTIGGKTRVTVFCNRSQDGEKLGDVAG